MPGTDYLTETTDTIVVDTIYHLLQDRRVTYIAMDIEGTERKAICGTEQTIRQWKPQLAISVYHRREDIFDLLLLIKSFVPDYKFFLRHYMYDQTETILYAEY
jgi:hypothetical protein